MKKILIICNYFAPDNTIAAVRITKIAKYLKRYGYDIVVVAENRQESIKDEILEKDAEDIKVIRVANSNHVKKAFSLYQQTMSYIKKPKYDNLDNRVRINPKTGKNEFYPFQTAYPFIGSLDYLAEIIRQYDLFKESKKFLTQIKDIDYIFASYGGYFGLFAGAYLHKKHGDIPWICDIRDAICNYKFTPKYVRWIALTVEKYIWRNASCITAVSKGLCRRVTKKYWNKVYRVTNGYDKEDRKNFIESNRSHNKMRLTYTGAMYGGLQDLSPLFECIRNLANINAVELSKIEFCFAGTESAYKIFESQANKYKLDAFCVYYGKVTRKEALKLQEDSDIVIVAAFDYQKEECGIITGKALEYMSAKKPIIAVINGDIEHSELGEIIRIGNLGFVYEEAHYQNDSKELMKYLLNMYNDFIEKGELEFNPNNEILRKFDYQYLTRKIIRIIKKI